MNKSGKTTRRRSKGKHASSSTSKGHDFQQVHYKGHRGQNHNVNSINVVIHPHDKEKQAEEDDEMFGRKKGFRPEQTTITNVQQPPAPPPAPAPQPAGGLTPEMMAQIVGRGQREGEGITMEQVQGLAEEQQRQGLLMEAGAAELQRQRDERDELLQAQQRQFADAIADIERQRQEQPYQDPRIGIMTEALGDMEQRLEQSQLERQALGERLQAMDRVAQEQQRQFQEHQQAFTGQGHRLGGIEQQMIGLGTNIGGLGQRLGTAEQRLGGFGGRLGTMEEEQRQHVLGTAARTGELARQQQTATQQQREAQQRLEQRIARSEALHQQAENWGTRLDDAQALLQQLQQRQQELGGGFETRIAQQQNVIDQIQQRQQQAEDFARDSTAQAQAFGQQLQAVEGAQAIFDQNMRDQIRDLNALEGHAVVVDRQLAQARADLDQLNQAQQQVGGMDARLGRQEQRVADLQEAQQQAQEQVQQQQQRVDTLEATHERQVQQISGKIDKHNRYIEDLRRRAEILRDQMGKHRIQLGRQEELRIALEGRMTGMEGRHQEIQRDIPKFLRDNLVRMGTEIDRHITREIRQLQTHIAMLERNIQTGIGDTADNRARIDEAERDIGMLRGDLDEVRGSVYAPPPPVSEDEGSIISEWEEQAPAEAEAEVEPSAEESPIFDVMKQLGERLIEPSEPRGGAGMSDEQEMMLNRLMRASKWDLRQNFEQLKQQYQNLYGEMALRNAMDMIDAEAALTGQSPMTERMGSPTPQTAWRTPQSTPASTPQATPQGTPVRGELERGKSLSPTWDWRTEELERQGLIRQLKKMYPESNPDYFESKDLFTLRSLMPQGGYMEVGQDPAEVEGGEGEMEDITAGLLDPQLYPEEVPAEAEAEEIVEEPVPAEFIEPFNPDSVFTEDRFRTATGKAKKYRYINFYGTDATRNPTGLGQTIESVTERLQALASSGQIDQDLVAVIIDDIQSHKFKSKNLNNTENKAWLEAKLEEMLPDPMAYFDQNMGEIKDIFE